MRSVPGPYEQYDGHVAVNAESEEDAIDAAFRKLKQTTFPDRGRSMWRVMCVERITQ
jgi:hypothetical protein